MGMNLSDCEVRALTESICGLTREIREMGKMDKIHDELKKGLLVIEHKLAQLENKIMAVSKAVQDYIDKSSQQLDGIASHVDELVTAQQGVAADVTFLKDVITKLQNNPGPISPEDQALLDQAIDRVTTLNSKMQGVTAALKELDAATAPDQQPPPPQ